MYWVYLFSRWKWPTLQNCKDWAGKYINIKCWANEPRAISHKLMLVTICWRKLIIIDYWAHGKGCKCARSGSGLLGSLWMGGWYCKHNNANIQNIGTWSLVDKFCVGAGPNNLIGCCRDFLWQILFLLFCSVWMLYEHFCEFGCKLNQKGF